MKILILKPSSLGDVIHALPVLRLLKLHFRDAQIYWWIDSNLAGLVEGDPDLTDIVRFERRRWASPLNWPEMFQSVRWMRGQQFDWVIDLQGLLRSAVFGWLARGKFFIGLDNAFEGGREGAHAFYDVAVQSSKGAHAVERCLSILPALEVPVHKQFRWLPERPQVAAGIVTKWPEAGAKGTRWIALQPGARWPTKLWPTKYFAETVRLLLQKFPEMRFAVMGSGSDSKLGEVIAAAAPERVLNLCGQTSLPEMIEWVRRCELMITNDTGPMHVAAALGVPLIALFGPTEPRFTGPYGQLENVLKVDYSLPCAPCFSDECTWKNHIECLIAISPMRVFEAARKKLGD